MADVAKAAGVSRALVSIVFRERPGASDATRTKVRKVAKQLGYRPHAAAQDLRRARSRNLGVLFSPQFPFEVEIVEAIAAPARERGYRVLLGSAGAEHDLKRAVEEMLDYRCEALIVVGLHGDDRWFTQLGERVPVVRVGRSMSASGVDAIHSDDREGSRLATQHLLDLGHRRIVCLSGGDMPGGGERLAGFLDAVREAGADGEFEVIPGDYSIDAGVAGALRMLDEPELPTAVVCGNDWSALGVLMTLLRRGVSVPAEVSIVGYDDSRLARQAFAELTSVVQDPVWIGESAVLAADQRIRGVRVDATEFVMSPRLVVRGSTAAPRS
ncbi:LacI family DNA-binding transcriptional regulator [Pseudoclavibacter terrae]|uniref:LacI family DNA-binding transcriptional regulator n=1 Tax=Pseudoclavibacter terrae TaxID=1530195 RepID=UPI0023304FA7|nr:LacI family DNA-binding transcriptional regulator [Pseudoclavibacter terrae]